MTTTAHPTPAPLFPQPPVSPGSAPLHPGVFLLGLRKGGKFLPGSARKGSHAARRAACSRSAAPGTHQLLATAHLISPGAWLCKEERQPLLEEGGGARSLRTPEPSGVGPEPSWAPGREEAEPLWGCCEAPLSRSLFVTASRSLLLGMHRPAPGALRASPCAG